MLELISEGKFLINDELKKEYRIRNRDYEIQYIKHSDPIPDGWEATPLRSTVKISRKKTITNCLKDKIWSLFFELGMKAISSSNFKIIIRKSKTENIVKQLDVVAYDDDVIFIVKCITLTDLASKKDLGNDISTFSVEKSRIIQILSKELGKKLIPVFILATENIKWSDKDRECAEDHKIVVIDEYDIMKLTDLANLAGNAAKYQLYNQVFFDRKIKNFKITIPALESKMGGKRYYMFSMVPEHLLKIAFVHQRKRSTAFQDLSDSYQRMLKTVRLKQIESFIEEGGFFPGNIILNFTRNPTIEKFGRDRNFMKEIIGDTRPVLLTLPPYYGCAWIIDGQHRLYGYSNVERRFTETIPVVAFIKESTSNQAKTFVDINKNQKTVPADLLWDLYEDLYVNSTDPKELHCWAISKLAKYLNQDGPFKGLIKIPMEGNLGAIDLNTFCRGLQRQNFISNSSAPFFRDNYEESIFFAAKRINEYFRIIKLNLGHLWVRGESGFVCSTAGINVLLSIMRDLIDSLRQHEIDSIDSFAKYFDDVLIPLILHLNDCSEEQLENYEAASVGRKQSSKLQADFTEIIARDRSASFRSTFLENWKKTQAKEIEEPILDLLKRNEDKELEFKGSFMLNLNRLIKADHKRELDSNIAKDGVLKTIAAFSNSGGGNLIIGIIEKAKFPEIESEGEYSFPDFGDYYLIGIEEEYGTDIKENCDKYELKIRDFLDEHLDQAFYDLNFYRLMEKTLCHIRIHPLSKKQYCYVDGEKFCIREGNRSIELKGAKIDTYKQRREIS